MLLCPGDFFLVGLWQQLFQQFLADHLEGPAWGQFLGASQIICVLHLSQSKVFSTK